VRSSPERGRRLLSFVGRGLLAGRDPMASAVGDVAELLDVDVDQFAGTLAP
jgi:hypothetical protein